MNLPGINILHVVGFYPDEKMTGNIFVKEQIGNLNESFPDLNIKVYNIETNLNKFNYFIKRSEFKNYININKVDIVHYHYGLTAIIGLFSNIKAKQIITFHGSDIQDYKTHRIVSKAAIKRFDFEIYVNKAMTEIVKPKNYDVIPCGVNSKIFHPVNEVHCRAKLGLPLDKKIILYAGNKNVKEKNYSLFSKCIKVLKQRDKNIITAELYSMGRESVALMINASDVVVLTSVSEGSPQIIKEAAFCHKPIVTSNVGDVRNILEGSNNSHIIETFVPLDFANSIEKALQKKDNEGFINLDGYDNRTISHRIYGVYKKVLGLN